MAAISAANSPQLASGSHTNLNSSGFDFLDADIRALGPRFDDGVGGFDVIPLGEDVGSVVASGQTAHLPFFECIQGPPEDVDYE